MNDRQECNDFERVVGEIQEENRRTKPDKRYITTLLAGLLSDANARLSRLEARPAPENPPEEIHLGDIGEMRTRKSVRRR